MVIFCHFYMRVFQMNHTIFIRSDFYSINGPLRKEIWMSRTLEIDKPRFKCVKHKTKILVIRHLNPTLLHETYKNNLLTIRKTLIRFQIKLKNIYSYDYYHSFIFYSIQIIQYDVCDVLGTHAISSTCITF